MQLSCLFYERMRNMQTQENDIRFSFNQGNNSRRCQGCIP